ncbi:MAG: hypothetical protein ACMUHB_01250 [Thermoplasmatota archaeon]
MKMSEGQYTGHLPGGGKVVAQFPCSMSYSWYLLTTMITSAFWVILIVFIGMLFGGITWIIGNRLDFLAIVVGPLAGVGVLAVLIGLVVSPYSFKKTVSGNKVKLTDEGIMVLHKPFLKAPVIRNLFSYDMLETISRPNSEDKIRPSLVEVLFPSNFFVVQSYKEGQLFLPTTRGDGILKLRMKRMVPVFFMDVLQTGRSLRIPGGMGLRYWSPGRKIYQTDTLFIDIGAPYHQKFLALVEDLKSRDLEKEHESSDSPLPRYKSA